MNELKFGDIFLVKFHPGFGSELKKYRPAVIVSEQVNIIDHRYTIISPLTTNTKNSHIDFEILIKNTQALHKHSLLLVWYLRTIDINRLEKKLGSLSSSDQTKLKLAQARLFQLNTNP